MTQLEHLENLFEGIPQDRKAAKARSFVVLENHLAGRTTILQDAEKLFDLGWMSAMNEAVRLILTECQQQPDGVQVVDLVKLLTEQSHRHSGAQLCIPVINALRES